jgi:glycosyltransferase involved in cell wall biosynthesis
VGHLAKNGYDLLACNAFPYVSVFAARLAALPRRMPIVLTWYEARGLDAWRKYAGPLYAPPAAALEALTARMSRYHTTISDFTAERMTAKLGIPRDRISMIPCGVGVREVNAGSQPPREKAILYVGRLVRHKRVDHLITAFAEATRDRPDHELRIVGPGAERESLEALAAASGVGERVKFLGTLTGEPMSQQYRRAQVFVLPSDQEGFGMVLLEAMAAGTPVIAKIAEHSAAKTVVHHEVNGLLFATKDELVAQLQRILGDEELRQRLAKNGLATANAHDWDSSIVPAYEEYFRKILDAGKSRGNNLNSA